MRREEQRHPEHHDQELGPEVDERDDERPAVQARAMDQTDDRDAGDHATAGDDVPGPVQLGEERARDIMRQEECRERNDDQVVEEEHPAGDEAPQIVERDSHERRGAARLPDGRRPLRIRERDDEEENSRRQEERGREPERVQGDDPECEVDRGGDFAVGNREERGSVEHPLEPGQLACHGLRLTPRAEQIEPAGAEREEEAPHEVAERAAVPGRRHRDERDADADEHDGEDHDPVAVGSHASLLRRLLSGDDHHAAGRVLEDEVDGVAERPSAVRGRVSNVPTRSSMP